MNQQHLDYFFSTLEQMFPDAETELHYSTPFQLLVAVILSAQTTDKQVNKVTAHFFDKIKTPQDLVELELEAWTEAIKGVNYYKTKAKNIYQTALMLAEGQSEYRIPETIEELIKLPGVGVKTARVVAHVLYGAAVIAVDTHVHRVCNRIGLVDTKTPEQTSDIIMEVVPERYLGVAHHCLILFGRYHCTAKKPQCGDCPFS